MRKYLLAAVTFVILGVAFPLVESAAEMAPIFGPQQFIRKTGTPEESIATFQNCETTAQYKLLVLNGNPDGTNRVSSATILLNGVQVLGPSDLNQKVGRIEHPIAISHDNQLRVRLTSKPDSFLTISVECTANCLQVQITSPPAGSTVNRSSTTVKGNILSSADEVGVVINGVVAQLQDGQFAAPNLPLALGDNTLTATATNSCLNIATGALVVHTTLFEDPPLRLTVVPSSGISPLTVTLQVHATLPNPINSFQWDFDGDGEIDSSGPTLSQVSSTYTQPGLFFPRVIVTDTQGNEVSDTTVINVLSPERMDALFKGKWQMLKGALANQQIEQAVGMYELGVVEKYRRVFTDLSDALPSISGSLGDITLISLQGNLAEYAIPRLQEGETFVYFIYFIMDQNGLWKIVAM
jgi:hypothetical protein